MTRWVLLAYRLPREPSTPRIGLWRQLRRLGVAQVADGVVTVPLLPSTREQLEWLADEVIENGGTATVWLAEPGSAAQERALIAELTRAVEREYERVIADAITAPASEASRRRTVARLRRELHRIGARDYFPTALAGRARNAVERLGERIEAAS